MRAMPDPGRVNVCPYCRRNGGEGDRCSHCGREYGNWRPSDSPCGSGVPFRRKDPIPVPDEGRLVFYSNVPLDGDEERLSVDLRSRAQAKVFFYLRCGTQDCWVFDASAIGVVRVNTGPCVRNQQLKPGDVVDIAGSRIQFAGGALSPAPDKEPGVELVVRGLTVSKGKEPGGADPILDDVSFDVPPGTFVGILGPSGCGKSTLMQQIFGFRNAVDVRRTGEILFNGRPLASASLVCAYLPQNAEQMLHDALTVRQELAFFLSLHGLTEETAKRKFLDGLGLRAGSHERGREIDEGKIIDALRGVQLEGKIDERVGSLSGGEKRRVAIAMTLLRHPKVLLLDEPTAGLDPATDQEVMVRLQTIAHNPDRPVSILCSTHMLGNVNRFDRVLVLTGRNPEARMDDGKGRRVYYGPPCAADGQPQELAQKLNAKSLADLYAKLQRHEREWMAPFAEAKRAPAADCQEAAGAPADVPFKAAFWGYLARMWKTKKLGLLLSLPVIIMVGIFFSCGTDSFLDPSDGSLYFCCTLALFYLGVSGSATRIVNERVPGRCLEARAGVPLEGYLGAKVVGSFAMSLVQTFLLCFAWWLLAAWTAPRAQGVLCGPVQTVWIVPVMLATALMGSLVGLAVSAVAKSKIVAVNLVPLFAIVALFFSLPTLGYRPNEVFSAKDDGKVAKRIAYVTPTVFAQAFLVADYEVSAAQAVGLTPEAVARRRTFRLSCGLWFLAVLTVVYVILPLALAFWREWRWEAWWNGREE